MNDTELRALEYLRRKEWNQAIALFDQLLEPIKNYETQNEKVVELLFGRSECFSELGRYEAVVNDCQKIINLISHTGGVSKYGSRAHRRLVLALFALQRFPEAEAAAKNWISVGGDRTKSQAEAEVLLNRVRLALRGFGVTSCYPKNMSAQHKLEEELLDIDSRLESWMGVGLPESRLRRNRRHPVELINEVQDADIQINEREQTSSIIKQFTAGRENLSESKLPEGLNQMTKADLKAANMATGESQPSCSYCALSFINQLELHAHCQTESHQMVIMSDEGRDWRWRPPPRGVTSDTYTLCESWSDGDGVTGGPCRYGNQCVEAHNPEELTEWRERFEYRRMKLQKACDKELYGKSYTEQLLERWMQSASPNSVMKEHLDGVSDSCSNDLVTSVVSKTSTKEWVITLKTPQILCAVALLQDAHRSHFMLKSVSSSNPNTGVALDWIPNNNQEWLLPPNSGIKVDPTGSSVFEHRATVSFATAIYGTFRQSVVFDLGSEPVMVKHLCVDVVPVSDADKIKEIKKELFVSTERWDEGNAVIVPFSHAVVPCTGNSYSPVIDGSKERELLNAYPSPNTSTFALTQSTITERKLTKNNYRARMHELLAVEEMARYQQVAQYNLTTRLRLANCYLLSASGMATSTTKYSHNGELFALMTLGKTVSEDTLAGRLILNNCTTVLIAEGKSMSDWKGKRKDDGSPDSNNGDLSDSATDEEGPKQKRVVYEALIEDKGKKVIYLRLSAAATKALNLKADTGFNAEVQFQLNRLQYCEWHYAIDRIPDYKIVFPDTYLEPNIPWSPKRQWSEILDSRLNLKQKEAVVAITTPISTPLPPILIIGPFGTGKTYTLAQAIKQVVQQPGTRVLVCTHSNSAADLYIRDYLHPHVEAGHDEARPLRIYYHRRWVATVNEVVQKYCLIDIVGGMKQFKIPSLEDIEKHRVVVVTLSISMCLASVGLKKDHFTHILLDEAAQAMECEAIMPLALASTSTRVVLAGDHMQLSPELFSPFARERNLHVSLLERLYDHYPGSFPCKILLCENYRAHQAIIKFTSELFYDQKLISSGKQPRHEKYYPLTFFTTRGEDVQDTNSTAFYNNSEVYEVVERVSELKKKWPAAWGKIDDQSIGIVTPYADQVFRIRSELRKRRMGGISVERVLNVQGKQFRAIFLSTVRTRKTCSSTTKSVSSSNEDMDYGFLSNSKLLNTAITRAQSLVAVVGDPVALCSIGRCRKVWERFIEICNENDSLYGITWSSLRAQLDGVELKKTYTLNPLAKEFVPRHLQQQLTEFRALSVLMQPPQPGNCPYLFFPLLLCPPGVPGVPQQALPGPGRNQAQGGVNPPFPINGPQVHHVNGALPSSTPHSASPTVFHQQWRMLPPPGNLPVGNLPVGNLPVGNLPVGNLPVGNLPVGNLPVGNLPVGNLPVGNIPVGNLPVGNIPVGNLPVGNLPVGNLPMGNIPNPAVTLTGNDSVMASGPPGVASQSVAGSLNQIGQSGQTVSAAGRITPVNWKNQQPTSGPPGDLLGLTRPPPGLILPSRSISASMSQNVPVANIQSGTYQNSSILNNLTGNIAGNTILPSNMINSSISSKNIVSNSPGGNIANLNLNHRNIPSPNVIQAGNMSVPVSVINSTTLNSGGGVLQANLLGGNLMNGGLLNTNRIPSNGNLVPSSTTFGLNVGAGIAVGSPSPASPAGNNLSQNEGVLSFGRGGPVSFVPSAFPLGEPVTVHPPPRKESQPVQLLLERQGPTLPPDWQVLLPPNVSLADIAESRSQQQEWYSHLTAIGEVSLAKRFLDLMWLCRNNPIAAASAANLNLAQRHQRQLSPSVNQAGDFTQPPPDTIRSINDLLNDRNSAQTPSVQSIQQQHHLVSNGLPVVLPFSNQQNKIHALHNGHLPPQIWAGPVGSSPDNKQALLVRDMASVIQGGALVNSNNGIAPSLQNIGPLSSPAFRTNHSLDIPVGDVLGQSNWSTIPPQQQSVPLYRRQPTLNQDHQQQQLSQQQSLSQQQQSLSQHQQPLSQHPQTLGQHQPSLTQHQQSVSQHQQSVSQHQQSVSQHQQSLGQHQQSLGQHQQSLGQHQQSISQHQQSISQHQQSISQHQPSMGQHQQSLGQHQQSFSQHQLSQQQQLNQQLAQQQHQQQIAQQHQLLKQQQIAQHQFSQQQHIQQLQLQRQQQQQNNRTQESPVSTSSLGHLLDGLNIDKGNMNSGYPGFVRGQLPSRELGHQYQSVQQVPPPPPPVQSSMRTTNGNDDSGDELLSSINRQTTYASVLRSQQKPPPVSTASTNGVEKTSDPFTLVSNLSRKRNQGSSPGFYQYFH